MKKNILVIAAVAVLVGSVAYLKQSRVSEMQQKPVANATGSEVAGLLLPRLLDLGSDKCAACKKMVPFLEELRVEYRGRVVIDFIDVLKDPMSEALFNVRIRPTQIFYDRDGEEFCRHEGYMSKEDIKAKFTEMGVK